MRPTIIPIIDTLNDSFTIHDDGIMIMLLSSSKRKFADIIELLLIRLFGWLVQVVVLGIVFTAGAAEFIVVVVVSLFFFCCARDTSCGECSLSCQINLTDENLKIRHEMRSHCTMGVGTYQDIQNSHTEESILTRNLNFKFNFKFVAIWNCGDGRTDGARASPYQPAISKSSRNDE